MAATPEGRVKRAITKMLQHYDVYYHMPVPGGYGDSTLDYVGCAAGKFFGIEAKAPGKAPTKLQELTLNRMQRAGGATFVIDDVKSPELDRLEAFLIETTQP